MPKDFEDPPKEPARKVAERKWTNNVVRQRFKAVQNGTADGASKEIKEPEIAATIKNHALKSGAITKAETMFAKHIRELMEGNARQTLRFYIISIRAQRRRLLLEKLRRLEARQAQAQPVVQPVKRDLFS